ncbi:hypothetical protein ACIF8T_35895 [Streptomyces sp. NPDC085946]|uniref:hypothetical protein n=1 Tax=Streptomyces sp. NPDC085946 TaxID=3365744 RepID=UPI0037D394CF
MTNIPAAVALALASVVAYATAAAVQHRVAERAAGAGLRAMLTDSVWWVSVCANGLGAVLHVAALAYGPLSLVQCLGALTVVVAVPIGARAAGRGVGPSERKGLCLTAVGFALLLPLMSTTGAGGTLTTTGSLAVAAIALLVTVLAGSVRHPGLRAPVFATASGIVSGTGSALTQTVLHTDRLLTWQTFVVALAAIGLAVVGVLLSQSAYTGGLGTSLAILTLANPLWAAVIGVALLGERFSDGALGTVLAVTGAVLTARGILLLARYSSRGPAAPPAVPTVEAVRRIADHNCPPRATVVSP